MFFRPSNLLFFLFVREECARSQAVRLASLDLNRGKAATKNSVYLNLNIRTYIKLLIVSPQNIDTATTLGKVDF